MSSVTSCFPCWNSAAQCHPAIAHAVNCRKRGESSEAHHVFLIRMHSGAIQILFAEGYATLNTMCSMYKESAEWP
jgi:hypothetical protein